MKIETQSQSGQVVISVREDRLDAHNSAELKGRFQRLLEEGGHRLAAGGLELGEAALVPAPPGETLNRRYGDCKDLSLLVVGLLRAAGLDARLALLRLDWQELDPEVPGISQFDHAVVRVEGAPPIWIDATVPFTPPGNLPPPAEGPSVLLITGNPSEKVVLCLQICLTARKSSSPMTISATC